MNTHFAGIGRNVVAEWEHDKSGANENWASVYGTRVPLVNLPAIKTIQGVGFRGLLIA
jgi:hypothetical protein